jgi:hypothetical protein
MVGLAADRPYRAANPCACIHLYTFGNGSRRSAEGARLRLRLRQSAHGGAGGERRLRPSSRRCRCQGEPDGRVVGGFGRARHDRQGARRTHRYARDDADSEPPHPRARGLGRARSRRRRPAPADSVADAQGPRRVRQGARRLAEGAGGSRGRDRREASGRQPSAGPPQPGRLAGLSTVARATSGGVDSQIFTARSSEPHPA